LQIEDSRILDCRLPIGIVDCRLGLPIADWDCRLARVIDGVASTKAFGFMLGAFA
jgi:hypothetical protein